MHKGQVVLHIDFVVGLQAAKSGTVLEIILFTYMRDFSGVEAHAVMHIDVHALFDGLPQSRGCRVKRIVEIEEDGSEFHSVIIPFGHGFRACTRILRVIRVQE